MNGDALSVASNKMMLDLNPVFTAPDAVAEISSRDKMVQSTIYAEVMKNLEISRTALIQETPTVKVVDEPELPLKINRLSLMVSICIGGFMMALFAIVFFLILSRTRA